MFLGILRYMSIFYYWTWFVWPFVFVMGFAFGLKDLIKDENTSGKGLIWAGIALMLIFSPFMWSLLNP